MDHFRCERCGSGWTYGFESITKQLFTQSLSIFWTGDECNQSNHERLCSEPVIVSCDLIIGVGGGRVLDMAKWAADSLHKPILCIPTIASTCVACSAVSVVYDENHQFLRIHELKNAPKHILFYRISWLRLHLLFYMQGLGMPSVNPSKSIFQVNIRRGRTRINWARQLQRMP